MELAEKGRTLGPVQLRGQRGQDVLGDAERRFTGKAGRREAAECRRQRGSQRIEQRPDSCLAHSFASRPVVGRRPDGAEVWMIDPRDHDQGRWHFALRMFDEVAIPRLRNRDVRRLKPLAAVNDQDQEIAIDRRGHRGLT